MITKYFKTTTSIERFNSFIVKLSGGCWAWTGARNYHKYGVFSLNTQNKSIAAHRYSYYLRHGNFESKLFVCHRCDNPPCVNPDHLFLGNTRDNAKDSLRKGRHKEQKKKFCPKGHEYSQDNLYSWKPKFSESIWRHCKICTKAYRKRDLEKNNELRRRRKKLAIAISNEQAYGEKT